MVNIFIMFSLIYELLRTKYPESIECKHWDTWLLWNKENKTHEEIFEVAIGTVLVQNTNWKNVDKAIYNLKTHNINSFKSLCTEETNLIENLIKPAGFYIQKSRYLKALGNLLLEYEKENFRNLPSRKQLLNIRGIGKETADSILVYCYYKSSPIVGAYTRRFFTRLTGDLSYLKKKYEIIQEELILNLGTDAHCLGMFHALIVCHCQKYCYKKAPKCEECFLKENCQFGRKKW